MTLGWKEREAQWELFHRWEGSELRELPPDLAAALAWMEQARETARRFAPGTDSALAAAEHWQHLGQVRSGLTRMRLPA